MMRVASFIALFSCAVFAQVQPKFGAADIQPSVPSTILAMRSAFSQGRYEIRNATLVELIHTAWGVDTDNVVGGPEWLAVNRFDVNATAPNGSTPETLKSMLRALLEERFLLVVRKDTRSLPAYALTVGKKLQLTKSAESDPSGCTPEIRLYRNGEPVVFTCRNMTMAGLADSISTQQAASGYLFNYRVVDQTGLKGGWNFSVKWSLRRAGPVNLGPGETAAVGTPITIFDAFEKQLGLKLKQIKFATPTLVVVSVNPAGNLVTQAPPARPMEFEVASIKPDPKGRGSNVGVQRGGQVEVRMTLKGLIQEAWGDMNPDRIVGGPKSMDATRWVVVAKAPTTELAGSGIMNGVDINTMRMMLRSLLISRFKLQAHMEDRLVDGYALAAAKPKLRKADPATRTGCKDGPGVEGAGANWKDPRIANPVASKLVTCRNMTLAQFAAVLSKVRPEENPVLFDFPPVVDSTGIEGRYDMTINFTPPVVIEGQVDWGERSLGSQADGTVSIFDAMKKQLGLKLESRKVVGPVLVIDHVDEMPTEN